MSSFTDFFTSAAIKAVDPEEKDTIYRLRRMAIDRVDLVDAGANKRTFLIRKDEGGYAMKTADMIPGAEGIKNSAGVVVTKADAMAGAAEDVEKLLEKMQADGANPPEGLVDSLKSISKVLSSVSQKAEEPPKEEEESAAPAEGEPAEPAGDEEDMENAKPVAKSASQDPFDVIDTQLAVVQKAGQRINKGSMVIINKAAQVIQALSGDLTTEEKKALDEKMISISKSLALPGPTHIHDGNSTPGEAPIPQPDKSGWTAYEDINL